MELNIRPKEKNKIRDISDIQYNIDWNVCEVESTKPLFNSQITQKMYKLFLSGLKYTVVELTEILQTPDPRSHIRFIRNKGVNILDYWINSKNSKYKVYFLEK
jgi:hypothetical protein